MDEMSKKRKMIFPIISEDTSKLPFYVTGVGTLDNQHRVNRPAGLPQHQFLYVSAGKGCFRIENKEYEITANMGFYFAPDIPHEYYTVEEPWTTWWVTYRGYAAEGFPAVARHGRYCVFQVYEPERLKLLHSDIYASAGYGGLLSAEASSGCLYRFLLGLKACIGTEIRKTGQNQSRQLQTVMSCLEQNFRKDITLSELSELAGISPQHLCRQFKQALGMRPMEFLARCRLKGAKELLTGADDLTLKEIASDTGFNDVSYFCSVFKHYEGMTPVEFRKMHRDY